MITILNIFILAVLSVLTTSFLPHLRIFGVVPLLTLFFVVQYSYFRKGFEPILLSALAGIYFDLFSPYFFGFYLLLFLLTSAFVRYFFGEGLRILSFWHYMIISMAATSVFYAGQLLIIFIQDGVKPGLSSIYPIGAGILVNLVFAILMYWFGTWYFDRAQVWEEQLKRQ